MVIYKVGRDSPGFTPDEYVHFTHYYGVSVTPTSSASFVLNEKTGTLVVEMAMIQGEKPGRQYKDKARGEYINRKNGAEIVAASVSRIHKQLEAQATKGGSRMRMSIKGIGKAITLFEMDGEKLVIGKDDGGTYICRLVKSETGWVAAPWDEWYIDTDALAVAAIALTE